MEELSPNVLKFEDAKQDSSKFEIDGDGHLIRALNGTLLSVKLIEYNETSALIEAESWFGNLGAVFPKYKANYIDGKWHLGLVSFGVS